MLARETVLLCEVGVTESAKSRLFAIRCVIHAAGSIGRGFAFPRRGDRTGGYRVFTGVRGFDVLELPWGVDLRWWCDSRSFAPWPRAIRGPMGAQTAQERPRGFLISRYFLPFVSTQTSAACTGAFFLRIQPFPHISFEYQFSTVSTFRRFVWCVHPISPRS